MTTHRRREENDVSPKYANYDDVIIHKRPWKPSDQRLWRQFAEEVLVIVHVVNDNELWAALDHMKPPEGQTHCVIYEHGSILGTFGGYKAALVQTKMGHGCYNEIERALQDFPNAQAVVAVGVAYASTKKCEYADVLVSTHIEDLVNVKFTKDDQIFTRGEKIEINQELVDTFCKRKDIWAIQTCFQRTESGSGKRPNIHPGIILSAPWLIDNVDIKDKLLDKAPEAVGGEMEGSVLLRLQKKLFGQPEPRRIGVIVIKGVADYADGSKGKKWQYTAAKAAVGFACFQLERNGEFKLRIPAAVRVLPAIDNIAPELYIYTYPQAPQLPTPGASGAWQEAQQQVSGASGAEQRTTSGASGAQQQALGASGAQQQASGASRAQQQVSGVSGDWQGASGAKQRTSVVLDAKRQEKRLSFSENFALSSGAAVISKTVAAPIERVKLLIQCQNENMRSGRLTVPYKGAINCLRRTYKAEGILPFWRGNLPNCLRYFPTQALNFAFKDKIKAVFRMKRTDPYAVKFAKNIASGAAAGALSLSFVYSLDYARTRLANDVKVAGSGGQGRQFNGLIDVYTKTLRSDGIVGLYRGFAMTCVGIVVYRGCYFGLYDTFRPVLLGENANLLSAFFLGYSVTITSGLISYPIDTIRRRMMMTSGEAVKYHGSLDCALHILRREGFMSMMQGAGVNIFRGIAGAFALVGFDSFKERYILWRGCAK